LTGASGFPACKQLRHNSFLQCPLIAVSQQARLILYRENTSIKVWSLGSALLSMVPLTLMRIGERMEIGRKDGLIADIKQKVK
jgi:hypothetical protein